MPPGWWHHTPIIPARRRQRQEVHPSRCILSYTVSSRPARTPRGARGQRVTFFVSYILRHIHVAAWVRAFLLDDRTVFQSDLPRSVAWHLFEALRCGDKGCCGTHTPWARAILQGTPLFGSHTICGASGCSTAMKLYLSVSKLQGWPVELGAECLDSR